MYAICTKINGVIQYLNRFETTKYNQNSLEAPLRVYHFGDIGESTVMANSEDWLSFLQSGGLEEIAESMRMSFKFDNINMAFVRCKKVAKYETTICKAFNIQEHEVDKGIYHYETKGLNDSGFC